MKATYNLPLALAKRYFIKNIFKTDTNITSYNKCLLDQYSNDLSMHCTAGEICIIAYIDQIFALL